MSLLTLLMGSLRVLFCGVRVLHTLRVITFSVMLCGCAMGLCRVLVMLRCLVMFVSSHWVAS